jgi:hypothetical protein
MILKLLKQKNENKINALIFNITSVVLVWLTFIIICVLTFVFTILGYHWLKYCILFDLLAITCFFITKNIIVYKFFSKKLVFILLIPLIIWLVLSSYFWYEFVNMDLVGGNNIFM